jgi:hypothetical protein
MFRKGSHHDIPKNISKYNDNEHQNSKYSHYNFKFYKTWIMYSRIFLNENILKNVYYIFSKFVGSNKISWSSTQHTHIKTLQLYGHNWESFLIGLL